MPRKKTEELTLDRLRAFVNGDYDKISDKDKKILLRLDFAYDQLKNETRANTVKRIVWKFKVSERQAQVDVKDCLRLFVPINRVDVEWLGNFIIEDAKLQLLGARAEGNHNARIKARAHLMKMFIVAKSEQSEIDPDMLGNNNYYVVVSNGDKMIQFNLDELNSLPLNKKMEITEDILFEEIDEEKAKLMMNE